MRLRSPRSAAASLLVPLALIAIAVLVGANGTPSLQGTVTLILCNLIIVLGLQVFIGNSGVYSFGQLGFAAAGAYSAALLTLPAAFVLAADARPAALHRRRPPRRAVRDADRRGCLRAAGGRSSACR